MPDEARHKAESLVAAERAIAPCQGQSDKRDDRYPDRKQHLAIPYLPRGGRNIERILGIGDGLDDLGQSPGRCVLRVEGAEHGSRSRRRHSIQEYEEIRSEERRVGKEWRSRGQQELRITSRILAVRLVRNRRNRC